jgi:hypothetical protein
MKEIRVAESTVKRIEVTPSTVSPLDPDAVAQALGAERCPEEVAGPLGPISLYAVRRELFRRLQEQGDRPGSEGNKPLPNISLNDEDRHKLEALAAQIATTTGLSPSVGQVGSVLLSLALRSVTAAPGESGTPAATAALVNELATRATS